MILESPRRITELSTHFLHLSIYKEGCLLKYLKPTFIVNMIQEQSIYHNKPILLLIYEPVMKILTSAIKHIRFM